MDHVFLLCEVEQFVYLLEFEVGSQEGVFHPDGYLEVVDVDQLGLETEFCLDQYLLPEVFQLLPPQGQLLNVFDCSQVVFFLAVSPSSGGDVKRVIEDGLELLQLLPHFH